MTHQAVGFTDISPHARQIIRTMAGEWADRYIGEVLLPELELVADASGPTLKEVREALMDPYRCLLAFFGHYAFARRGKDRPEYETNACNALRRLASPEDFLEHLKAEDGEALWQAFSEICAERKRKNPEQLNKGIIAGMLELAQEIYSIDAQGSVAGWILSGVLSTGRIEPQFLRVVDIRGVGPKTTSTYLRDMVLLFGIEGQVDNADKLFLQPIDRWIRMIASQIVTEVNIDETVDWVLAGKLNRYTRKSGISGIRFNMGATYFGQKEIRDPARFEQVMQEWFPTVPGMELEDE